MTDEELTDETRRLLNEVRRDIRDSQIAMNIGVYPSWLCMFKTGTIKQPKIETVKRLHAYLISLQA